jgi:hypothetical protein
MLGRGRCESESASDGAVNCLSSSVGSDVLTAVSGLAEQQLSLHSVPAEYPAQMSGAYLFLVALRSDWFPFAFMTGSSEIMVPRGLGRRATLMNPSSSWTTIARMGPSLMANFPSCPDAATRAASLFGQLRAKCPVLLQT